MANEVKKTYKTTINHIVAGAQLTAGSYSTSETIDNAIDSTATGDYPFADIVLTIDDFSAAPAAGETVNLFRRDINIVSTSDEPAVDANYRQHLVGAFVLDAADEAQYLQLTGIELTKECEFVIQNNCASATINASWDLDVKPWTYVPT